ncbi:GDSL esterase/lipase-like protein [Drosera capensis]
MSRRSIQFVEMMHWNKNRQLEISFESFLKEFPKSGSKLPEGVTVPTKFVFGDSIVDSGNNNYIITACRSNFVSYGRDFEDVNRREGSLMANCHPIFLIFSIPLSCKHTSKYVFWDGSHPRSQLTSTRWIESSM